MLHVIDRIDKKLISPFFYLFHRCNVLYGTPTMFVDLLNLPDLKNYDVSSLSLSAMGGAPCPLELAKQAAKDLNIKHCLVKLFISNIKKVN